MGNQAGRNVDTHLLISHLSSGPVVAMNCLVFEFETRFRTPREAPVDLAAEAVATRVEGSGADAPRLVQVFDHVAVIAIRRVQREILRVVVSQRKAEFQLERDRPNRFHSKLRLNQKMVDPGVGIRPWEDVEERQGRVDRGGQQSLVLAHPGPGNARRGTARERKPEAEIAAELVKLIIRRECGAPKRGTGRETKGVEGILPGQRGIAIEVNRAAIAEIGLHLLGCKLKRRGPFMGVGLDRSNCLGNASPDLGAKGNSQSSAEGFLSVAATESIVGNQRQVGPDSPAKLDLIALPCLRETRVPDRVEGRLDLGRSIETRGEGRRKGEQLAPHPAVKNPGVVHREMLERVEPAPQPEQAVIAELHPIELIAAPQRATADLEVARSIALACFDRESSQPKAIGQIGVLAEICFAGFPAVSQIAEFDEASQQEPFARIGWRFQGIGI